MQADKGLLFSINSLLSAYGEKDQLTVIGNAQNVDDSDVVVMVMGDDGEGIRGNQGLSTAYQLGVNANTSRIKDVETAASANYKYSDTDSGTLSSRTTYLDGEDLFTTTENIGKQYAHSLTTNLEMEKEKGKVWFHFRPDFRYSRNRSQNNTVSETTRNGVFVNKSESSTQSLDDDKTLYLDGDVSFMDLGGKKGRNLRLNLGGGFTFSSGESDDGSLLKTAAGTTENRQMHYLTSPCPCICGRQVIEFCPHLPYRPM